MAKPHIGGDKWRALLLSFEREFNRHPTHKELAILRRGFYSPPRKTKGRATDYRSKGAETSDCSKSAALRNMTSNPKPFDDTSKAVTGGLGKPLTARAVGKRDIGRKAD